MGRKLRAHAERRNEILDGAWELFTTRGYEGTTVAAIIDRLGISKGTFYHYFESKEQILDAITDRLSLEPLAELRQVIDDEDLEAGPKLNRFLEVARRSRLRRFDAIIDVARVLYREENLIIRHKINARLLDVTVPLLRTIIQQGIEEGHFRVADAGETALFLWVLSSTFADQQMLTLLGEIPPAEKVGRLVRRADLVAQCFERVLAAEAGSIHRPSAQVLERFVRAVQGEATATASRTDSDSPPEEVP